ncbi:MAG TPA: hypothetical protein VIY27_10205 [Myxococcota bacterium]
MHNRLPALLLTLLALVSCGRYGPPVRTAPDAAPAAASAEAAEVPTPDDADAEEDAPR